MTILLQCNVLQGTLSPGLHVDITLTCATYLIIHAEQVDPPWRCHFQWRDPLSRTMSLITTFRYGLRKMAKSISADIVSQHPRSQANHNRFHVHRKMDKTSPKTKRIHYQFTCVRYLHSQKLPDYFQIDQSCFGGKTGTNVILYWGF